MHSIASRTSGSADINSSHSPTLDGSPRLGKPSSHPGAARVGIGGPVGSGKTALLEQLIPRFTARGTDLAVITNDLVTKEDAWSSAPSRESSSATGPRGG